MITAVGNSQDRLLTQADEAKASVVPAGWTGTAAVAAAEKLQRVGDAAELVAAELAATKRAVIDAADAITGLTRSIEEAQELARRYGFTITDSGTVPPQPCTADTPLDVVEQRRRIRLELIDRIEQSLRHADDIDRDLCAVLRRILDGNLVDVTTNNLNQATGVAAYTAAGAAAGALSEVLPPKNATPSDNAAWWATLSDQARTEFITDHPNLVGPRDGLPTAARDTANRALLHDAKGRLDQRLAQLRHELVNDPGGPGGRTDRQQLQDQIEVVKGKLDGIEAITHRLDQTEDAPAGEKYYLLGIDGTGDGQAIIAKGNPDTADNVATYVPGTGSDLSGISGGIDRSDAMLNAADKAAPPSASTSVITWYGYDAPDDLISASSEDYANAARQNLDSFQQGLTVSHDDSLPPAHNTVLGHSYGGTVVGYAGRGDTGLATDELVLVAAPGAGVDNADGLNMPDGHVWATCDPDDPVGDLQVFGNDPTDDDFGAHTFEADSPAVDATWYDTAAHSDYWEPKNPSLRAMGHIIAGRPIN